MKSSIWGEGLHTRIHWGGLLRLRRNSLVYDIELCFWRVRLSLLIYRKKK